MQAASSYTYKPPPRVPTVVTMLLLLLPLLSLAAAQPGAPWTEEEALAVKAKLYAMFDQVKASTTFLQVPSP